MKRWNSLMAASLISLTGTTGAMAFDPDKYQAVQNGHSDCVWCDLRGANLSNFDFAGADLSGADLTEADLSGADLRNADLTGTDLTAAVLDGTNFTGVEFKGADLDQVDLTRAVLVGAKLEQANCDWATKFPEASGLSCMGVTIVRK